MYYRELSLHGRGKYDELNFYHVCFCWKVVKVWLNNIVDDYDNMAKKNNFQSKHLARQCRKGY